MKRSIALVIPLFWFGCRARPATTESSSATNPSTSTTVAAQTTCSLPAAGQPFTTALPGDVALNASIVEEAINYANTHGRLSVQIFRHNCKIAEGVLDPVADEVPNNIWSSTKSVVSILTGMAYDRGVLKLDDPIGDYLPTGLGWGDAAHRAITIRDLLTETAGLQEAIISEAETVGLDQSAPQEALAQKIEYPAGTHFEYTQRVPDLLLYVVQRALGVDDIQAFAQENLFGPLGIAQDSYFWLRDRSGNTYGYAFLFLPPSHLAKIGLLMLNQGSWRGQQILSPYWVTNVAKATSTNPCYGWLFWTNQGDTCTGANIFSAQTLNHPAIPTAPRDLFATIGALEQDNFIIPSLDMTVTWTGLGGNTEPNLDALITSVPADLFYNFFQILMRAVEDVHVPDPGPFQDDPFDFDVNPINYANPQVLAADIAGNPGCNILVCNDNVPTQGAIENLQAIADLAAGL